MQSTPEETDDDDVIRAPLGGSRVVAAVRTLRRWARQSRLARVRSKLASAVSRLTQSATATSRTVGVARTVESWVRTSFLYRWLTKEPEPEVIVIDLRETVFVGPIIEALDRTAAWLGPRWHSSRIHRLSQCLGTQLQRRPVRAFGIVLTVAVVINSAVRIVSGSVSTVGLVASSALLGLGVLAMRSDRSLADLRETRTWQVLVAVFEPPPPEDADSQAGTSARSLPDTETNTERDEGETTERDGDGMPSQEP